MFSFFPQLFAWSSLHWDATVLVFAFCAVELCKLQSCTPAWGPDQLDLASAHQLLSVRKSGVSQHKDPCPLGCPVFPRTPAPCPSAPLENGNQPEVPSLRSGPPAGLSQHPALTSAAGGGIQAASLAMAIGHDLCGGFPPLCFLELSLTAPLWFWSFPGPYSRESFLIVRKLFFLQVPVLKLCLYHVFIFCLALF